MIDAGILTAADRCKLLEGQLVMRSPIRSSCSMGIPPAARQGESLNGGTWHVRIQQPGPSTCAATFAGRPGERLVLLLARRAIGEISAAKVWS